MPSHIQIARELRQNQTKTEDLLWDKINKFQTGEKARRQFPITIRTVRSHLFMA